jgi:hypothetical protein
MPSFSKLTNVTKALCAISYTKFHPTKATNLENKQKFIDVLE